MTLAGYKSDFQVYAAAGGASLVWHDPLTNPSTTANYTITAIGAASFAIAPAGLTVTGNDLTGFTFALNPALFTTLENFLMRITLVSANTGTTNRGIVKLNTGARNSASTFFVQGILNAQVNASTAGHVQAGASNASSTSAASATLATPPIPVYLQTTCLRHVISATIQGTIFSEIVNVNPAGNPWSTIQPVSAHSLDLNGLNGSFAPSFTVLADGSSPDFGGATTVKDFYLYSLDSIAT